MLDPAAAGSPSTPRAALAPTLRDLVGTVFYHKRAIAIAFMLPVILGLLAAASIKAAYVAQARLLVLYSSDYVYRPTAGEAGGSVSLDRNQIVLAELQVLQSTVLAEQTLRQVGLDRVYPGAAGKGGAAMAGAAARFESDLTLASVPQSNVLELGFRNRDPDVAAEVLRVLIDKYLALRSAIFERAATPAALADQAQFLGRLHAAEQALARFAGAHGIYNLDEQTALLLRERSALVQARTAAERDVSQTQAKLDAVHRALPRTARTLAAYTDTARSQQSEVLTDDLVKLEIKRRELAARYQDDFPAVQDVDRQLDAARRQLVNSPARDSASARNAVNPVYQDLTSEALSLQAQLSGAQATIAALTGQLQDADRSLAGLTAAGQQYRDLTRDRDVLDESYRTVVRSNEEALMADTAERGQTPNVRVIQPPERPAGRSLRLAVAAASLLVGVLAAAAVVLALNALRQVFVTSRQVVAALNLPVLVAVNDLGEDAAIPAKPARTASIAMAAPVETQTA